MFHPLLSTTSVRFGAGNDDGKGDHGRRPVLHEASEARFLMSLNFGDCFFGSGSVAGIVHDDGKATVGHPHSGNAEDLRRRSCNDCCSFSSCSLRFYLVPGFDYCSYPPQPPNALISTPRAAVATPQTDLESMRSSGSCLPVLCQLLLFVADFPGGGIVLPWKRRWLIDRASRIS